MARQSVKPPRRPPSSFCFRVATPHQTQHDSAKLSAATGAPSDARHLIDGFRLPPTVVTDTGGGLQAFLAVQRTRAGRRAHNRHGVIISPMGRDVASHRRPRLSRRLGFQHRPFHAPARHVQHQSRRRKPVVVIHGPFACSSNHPSALASPGVLAAGGRTPRYSCSRAVRRRRPFHVRAARV